MPPPKNKASFIEPMLLLRSSELPDSREWLYEIKLDGYRAIAFKTGGKVHLRSRNDNDFNTRYPSVVSALSKLPDETVIDGEVVALDESGRPSFNILQNYGSAKAPVLYYVFDVMMLAGRDMMAEALQTRRDMLERKVMNRLREPVRLSPELNASVHDLVRSVR
jgi:bifunctional non-homologous end joining protein LigD